MLTALTVLGVLAALFLAAALATRDEEGLAPAPPDSADVALPQGRLRAEDVAGVRFGLALRGYRMSEVDDVLERLASELAERDAELASLRGSGADSDPAGSAPLLPAEPPLQAPPAPVVPPTSGTSLQPPASASGGEPHGPADGLPLRAAADGGRA